MCEVPPFADLFDDEEGADTLEVVLAVPCRLPSGLNGPRRILGALARTPGEDPVWVAGWRSDGFVSEPPALWGYFEEGSWNNGYTTAVRWLRVANVADAPAVLEHLADLLEASPEVPAVPEAPIAIEGVVDTAVEATGEAGSTGETMRQLWITRSEPPN